MIRHVGGCYPEEACGLLAGRIDRPDLQADLVVEAALPVTNRLHERQAYDMDPGELLAQLMWIDAQNLEIVGVYHSHPSGPPQPSHRDIAASLGAGIITVICYPVTPGDKQNPPAISWQARGFINNGESTSEIVIKVTDN